MESTSFFLPTSRARFYRLPLSEGVERLDNGYSDLGMRTETIEVNRADAVDSSSVVLKGQSPYQADINRRTTAF